MGHERILGVLRSLVYLREILYGWIFGFENRGRTKLVRILVLRKMEGLKVGILSKRRFDTRWWRVGAWG